MCSIKYVFLTLIVFNTVLSCLPAQQIDLSVEDAVNYALKNNISLKQSKIKLDSKKREKNTSWNSASPKISASGQYVQTLPNPDDVKSNTSLGISASVSFSTNLFTSIKSAAIAYEQEQITYEEAKSQTELNVRKLYYSLIYETQNLELNKKSLATAKNQYESNLAKYQRGILSQVDVLSAQISYDDARLNVQSLTTSLENSTSSFKQTLGLSQDTELNLTGSFDFIHELEEVSLEGIETYSTKIHKLEKQVELAQTALTASRFSVYGPTLSASYGYSTSSNDGGEEWNKNGKLTLSASIPLDGLMPWSQSRQNIQTAKDALNTYNLTLEDEKTTFEIKIKNYLNLIRNSASNIKQTKSSINLAQQNYEMTLEAYNHGTKNLLVLQTSFDNLLRSKVHLLSECYKMLSYILELENHIGIPYGTLLNKNKD